MAHKVCSILHILLAVALVGLANTLRSSSDATFWGFLILASIAVAVGCWTRRRWLVALAGVPIMIGGVVAFGVGALFHEIARSNEMGFLTIIAMLVWTLEITSFVYAKKPPEGGAKRCPGDANAS